MNTATLNMYNLPPQKSMVVTHIPDPNHSSSTYNSSASGSSARYVNPSYVPPLNHHQHHDNYSYHYNPSPVSYQQAKVTLPSITQQAPFSKYPNGATISNSTGYNYNSGAFKVRSNSRVATSGLNTPVNSATASRKPSQGVVDLTVDSSPEDMLLSLKHGPSTATTPSNTASATATPQSHTDTIANSTTRLISFHHPTLTSYKNQHSKHEITVPVAVEPIYSTVKSLLSDEFVRNNTLYRVPSQSEKSAYQRECNKLTVLLAWFNAELQSHADDSNDRSEKVNILMRSAVDSWFEWRDGSVRRKRRVSSELEEIQAHKEAEKVVAKKRKSISKDNSSATATAKITKTGKPSRKRPVASTASPSPSPSPSPSSTSTYQIMFHNETHTINAIPYSTISQVREHNTNHLPSWLTNADTHSSYLLYPNFAREGNRRVDYETQCNDIGLCFLHYNRSLVLSQGSKSDKAAFKTGLSHSNETMGTVKKGVLQKIVDKWRNESPDLKSRSRTSKRTTNYKKRRIMALIQMAKGHGKQCFEAIDSAEIQATLEKPWRDFVKDLEDFMGHGFDFIGNGLDQLEKRKQTALEKLYLSLAGLIDEQLAGCTVDVDTKTNLLKVSELAKLLHELTVTVVQSKIEHDAKHITQAQIDTELQIFEDQVSEISGTGQKEELVEESVNLWCKNDGVLESDESAAEISHSKRMSIDSLLS